MKRRRYIAYVLTVVCMIMLTASVFPHHHHFNRICLQHTVKVCDCSCEQANSSCENEDHGACRHSLPNPCENGCITKFNCSVPQNGTDVLLYFPPVTLLYSFADILKSYLPDKSVREQDFPYIESLHSLTVLRTEGLRAPPCA